MTLWIRENSIRACHTSETSSIIRAVSNFTAKYGRRSGEIVFGKIREYLEHTNNNEIYMSLLFCFAINPLIWIIATIQPKRRRQTLKTVDRRLTWSRFSLNLIKCTSMFSWHFFLESQHVSCSIAPIILRWKMGNAFCHRLGIVSTLNMFSIL